MCDKCRSHIHERYQSSNSIWICRFISIGNPFVEKRSRKISTVGVPILERHDTHVELGTRSASLSTEAQTLMRSITNKPWWRHQMETFSALLALCARNSPVTGEFPTQRPVTRSFDVFFDLRLNKRLSKQWWGWWFEPSRPLWRHCNVYPKYEVIPWFSMGYKNSSMPFYILRARQNYCNFADNIF